MKHLAKAILFTCLLSIVTACGSGSIYAQNSAANAGVVTGTNQTSSSSGSNSSSTTTQTTTGGSAGATLPSNPGTTSNASPPRANIVCSSGGRVPAAGGNVISFAASQCTGGVLPNSGYVGILTGFAVNGGTSGEFAAYQPAQGSAPSVWFYAKSNAGNYSVTVNYLPIDASNDLFFCTKSGAIPVTGGNSVTFVASDCGGRAIDSSHLAIPVALFANGGTSGEFGFGQPINGSAPSVWWYGWTAAGHGNYSVSAAFIKKPAASTVVTCSATAGIDAASAPGSQNITYAASQCNGAYPSNSAVVIPTGLASNGGTSGEFGFNGASVWWWAAAAGGNFQTISLFLE